MTNEMVTKWWHFSSSWLASLSFSLLSISDSRLLSSLLNHNLSQLIKKKSLQRCIFASLSWGDHQKGNYIFDRETKAKLRMETERRRSQQRSTFIEIYYWVVKIFNNMWRWTFPMAPWEVWRESQCWLSLNAYG